MSKVLKTIVMSLSLLLMIGITGVADELAPPNVELEGNSEGIVYIPGDEPFLQFNNMIPGDKIKRSLIMNNKHSEEYEIFLRAERINEKEEFDLLEKLNMNIIHDNKVLHDGDATGAPSIEEDISLGVINPGEKKEITAEVVLDGAETGNEYKGKEGSVRWVFTAVRTGNTDDNTVKPNLPNDTNGNISTRPPKTGDNGILNYLLIIVIGAILLVVINRKGGKQNEKN